MYDAGTICKYCNKLFTDVDYKCRHHDHKTGNYTAPACRRCNLRLTPSYKKSKDKLETYFHIPVVFHNLKNYDSHFIIRSFNRRLVRVGEDKYKDVSVVATSSEKFIAFDINYLRFIDSVQFLSASLDTLVKNLHKAGEDNFVHTVRHMESEKYIFQKGVFPYEWFTSRT